MSSYSDGAIGGYFELELPRIDSGDMVSTIKLNTARNCLEYILETSNPTKVYIPYYTCDVILEPFEKTGVKYEFYHIDDDLEVVDLPLLEDGELFLYTNYFGIKDTYTKLLIDRYRENLIVDASQAYFYTSTGVEKVFYSPRKFFGVSDGGLLVTDKKLDRVLETDISNERMAHLLKRLELNPEEGYEDFKRNDDSLKNMPILQMSRVTQKILQSINYVHAADVRKANFHQLHEALGNTNKLSVVGSGVPMVYPYLVEGAENIRKTLIDRRIFVATYWPNIFQWCNETDTETYLARNILPLPVDQRYTAEDMKRIIEVVNESTH